MNLDFTMDKYKQLCNAISRSEYTTLTFEEYISSTNKPEKVILIRHDVDSEPEYFLKTAKLENELGLSSTYYFRHIEGIFLPDLIKKIAVLGHEIGYHYEVLDKARGDYEVAIKLFGKELEDLREYYNVRTIAQHGSPLVGGLNATSLSGVFQIIKALLRKEDIFTSVPNIYLWNKYNLQHFDIIGEAYLSMDFNKTIYLSDTGRSWDSSRYKVRDFVNTSSLNLEKKVEATDDIIDMIQNNTVESMCILVHSNQWKDNYSEWLKWLLFQQIRNNGKLLLKKARNKYD